MTAGDAAITVRLVDGQYPNYQQVIPAKFDRSVKVNTAALIGCLRRAELVAGDRASMVKLGDLGPNARRDGEFRRVGQRLRRNRSRADRRGSHDRVQRALSRGHPQPRQVAANDHRVFGPALAGRDRAVEPAEAESNSTSSCLFANDRRRVRLTRVSLSNFRNYGGLDLEPRPGLNVFSGPTPRARATCSKPSRCSEPGNPLVPAGTRDLVRDGLELAGVSAATPSLRATSNRLHDRARSRGTRKRYSINDAPVRYARFLGRIEVVTFVPADLQLVCGAPALRRGFLNVALAQEDPRYFRALARYRKTFNRRPRSARRRGRRLLAIYERRWSKPARQLMLARKQFVDALARSARTHARWTGRQRSGWKWRTRPASRSKRRRRSRGRRICAAPARRWPTPKRARRPLAGPHRDDLGLGSTGTRWRPTARRGNSARRYSPSKVAEYTVMRERANERLCCCSTTCSPNSTRSARGVSGGVAAYEQAFVTATHLPGGLPAALVRADDARRRASPEAADAETFAEPRRLEPRAAGRRLRRSGALLGARWREIVGADVARHSIPRRSRATRC